MFIVTAIVDFFETDRKNCLERVRCFPSYQISSSHSRQQPAGNPVNATVCQKTPNIQGMAIKKPDCFYY
jgi:hypothetical protein